MYMKLGILLDMSLFQATLTHGGRFAMTVETSMLPGIAIKSYHAAQTRQVDWLIDWLIDALFEKRNHYSFELSL